MHKLSIGTALFVGALGLLAHSASAQIALASAPGNGNGGGNQMTVTP